MSDALFYRLDVERQRRGRGNLVQHRELWRSCDQAFREWSAAHVVDVGATLFERRLTEAEMVEWLRMANDYPASARAVLRMQRAATQEGKRVALEIREPGIDESRAALAELHEYGVLAAQYEWNRAEKALEKAVRESGQFGNAEARIAQRRRMLTACDAVVARLADQLQILRTAARSARCTRDV